MPIKAGTRLVSVAFTNAAPRPGDRAGRGLPSVDQLLVSGPFEGRVPEDTPTRRLIFSCRPALAAEEEPCAREILASLARRAYRRPLEDTDVSRAASALPGRASRPRTSTSGSSAPSRGCCRHPSSCSGSSGRQPGQARRGVPHQRSGAGLSAVVLPLAEHARTRSCSTWRRRESCANELELGRQVRRMLGARRATRLMNDFAGQWLQIRKLDDHEPDVRFAALRRHHPQGHDPRDRVVLRESGEGGSSHPGSAARRLHVS